MWEQKAKAISVTVDGKAVEVAAGTKFGSGINDLLIKHGINSARVYVNDVEIDETGNNVPASFEVGMTVRIEAYNAGGC